MSNKSITELKGSRVVAKVKLHNYRFPRSGHVSGDYAIVILDVVRVVEGEIPNSLKLGNSTQYQIVATGSLPRLDDRSEYIFQGILIIDKEWGPQYETEAIRLDYDLSCQDDQKKFFSYFMTEKQINSLFEISESPITLLEQKNIGELTKVKGIGPAIAARMCARYEECKNSGRAYVALKKLELTKRVIDRLIKHYGSADIVVDKIETNPYILIKEIRGIGWKKADDFAKRQGMANDCPERVIAYIQYYLEQQADMNGNTWISIEDLLANIQAECLPITKEKLASLIKENIMRADDFNKYYIGHRDGSIDTNIDLPMLYYDKPTRRISLISMRVLEQDIAHHIHRLESAKSKFKYDKEFCKKIISECEKEQGFNYTDEQISAIWSILDNNVSILTGSAGTGKSSTLKPVIQIFEHYGLRVDQCALSGRASSLLGEYTGLQGKTIHRLLAFLPDTDKFNFTERNPLHSDVIILDETSMVGGELFLSLVSAIKTGSKFLMLGDTHQLESIGLANILKDCISSGYIKTTVLTKIHRQAAMSGIISQSLLVSSGESIVKNNFSGEEIRGELKDFKLIATFDTTLVQNKIISEFKHLYFERKIPLDDIQVIVPMKTRGDTSCRVLNSMIQQLVNPKVSEKDVTVNFNENGIKYSVVFKPNDKIIVVKNNYHAEGTDGTVKQIFNGNIGKIKDISEDIMIITIPDNGDIILSRDQWDYIQLAYAITVHKKQGDSVPFAIIGLDTSAYALLSKELLYTAITRASKFCTLIVQPKAANIAVKTSRVKLKQTWLKDDLLQYTIERNS